MKSLFILNGPPYGTEHSYNALRLARNLLMKDAGEVRLFLDLVEGAERGTMDQLTEWSVRADKVFVF